MAKFGIGQPVKRVEDLRLVTGDGRYIDDINLDGQAYLAVVRSPHAHAVITGIDTDEAKAAPGVLGVYTAADLGGAGIPCFVTGELKNADGSRMVDPGHPILTGDKARYVGDNVAFVVAETKAQARDAVDLVEVDYDVLDAITDTRMAAEPGKPQVHDGVARNLGLDWHHGDAAATEKAFAKAAHVTRLELINNRVVCNAMEPRAAVSTFDRVTGQLTVHTTTQGGWPFRDTIASNLGMDADDVVVLTPADVGGGFGMKAMHYSEYTMTAFAAKKLGRPVKWTGERTESFLSDSQGRDHVTTAELALDADNRTLGMRVTTYANFGAYYYFFAPFIPTGAAVKVLPGVYDIPAISYSVKGVVTNTVPVDAYRGAGRPESIYCVERLIEKAAREVGMNVLEFRRLNFIKPDQMPYRTSVGELYDTGEFDRVMTACIAKSDWSGVAARKEASAAKGKYRGIGMCYYIESTMGDPNESAGIEFNDDGTVSVLVGTQANGQGHETAYAQVLHQRLGVPFDAIKIVQGDTKRIKGGGGTGGSRSLTAQGMAINDASDKVIERGKAYAAQHFETAIADIAFEEGAFKVAGTDRVIEIMALAKAAKTMASPAQGVVDGLDAAATHTLAAWTFPNGCHIAEIEIDPDTGITSVERYSIVDDFGVVVNPMLVEGQVHGGVVQGIGQALFENTVYDEGGQLLTGSFMDYTMPRADNMPSFDFSTVEVPCENNAMGVKGCGEAGSVGSCAAVINAMIDALYDLGVKEVDMPATSEKVWRLTQAARVAKAA